jgi:nitroreductase
MISPEVAGSEAPTALSVIEAIRRRRSIRRYRSDPIPESVLGELLEMTRLAPSGCNAQPWRFVVVRDEATRARLAEACTFVARRSGEVYPQRWIAGAPVVVVAWGFERDAGAIYVREGQAIVADGAEAAEDARHMGVGFQSGLLIDLAIAFDHLALAATALGLGTCWIAGLNEPKVKEVLGIPAEARAPLAMTLGYPAEWPGPRPRKQLSGIVFYDRYS